MAPGCRTWPAQPVVSDVTLRGTDDLDHGPLLDQLATAETPALFGIFHRVLEYCQAAAPNRQVLAVG